MPTSDRIDELKKRYDENPRRFFASLANEYRKAGDLDQAISICQAHLAEQPSNMNGHVVYGQALFEAGRYDEAKTTFESALALDPENLIALRHLGDIACTNGANESAREWYERVLDADPRNEEIIALLAHLAAEGKRADGPPAEPAESPAPRESRSDFAAPQAVTPLSTPLSTPPVADPTPVVPLDAVKTIETPAYSPPAPAASRPSLGLMDLAIDFETPSEAMSEMPPVAQPVANAETPPDPAESIDPGYFPEFEEVALGTPFDSTTATSEPSGDLLINPFDPDPEPVAEFSEGVESAQPEPPAQPFVTETMAELYVQQGFTAEALDVYRQLSAAAPDDEELKSRVRSLEPAPEPVAEPEPQSVFLTVRSYFAGLAARRAVQGNRRARTAPRTSAPRVSSPQQVAADRAMLSLEEMFSGGAISSGDELVALAFAQVAGAVEMGGTTVKGKPTAPAETELSLDSVFHKSEARVTTPVARQSQTLRFDQFFTPAGDESGVPAAPSMSAPTGEPGSPAELQQFQSWLTGLKKP